MSERDDDTHDGDHRWETLHLKQDQFEQVLATDMVETIRVDPELAKSTTAQDLPGDRRYGSVLLLFVLAIVATGVALLLQSGFWDPPWATAGIIVCGLGALAAAVFAVRALLGKLGLISGAEQRD